MKGFLVINNNYFAITLLNQLSNTNASATTLKEQLIFV